MIYLASDGQKHSYSDTIKSAQKTYENYIYMLSKIKSKDKLLPVFHMGESFECLQKFLQLKDLKYMCISAKKDYTPKQRQNWYDLCFNYICKNNRQDIKIHCLGSGTISDVESFPFCSTDSTTWIQGSAYGELCTDFGRLYLGSDKYSKNHISYDEVKLEYLKSKCLEYELNFDDLLNDYNYRLYFNICYMLDKSKNTECNYYKRNHYVKNNLF